MTRGIVGNSINNHNTNNSRSPFNNNKDLKQVNKSYTNTSYMRDFSAENNSNLNK